MFCNRQVTAAGILSWVLLSVGWVMDLLAMSQAVAGLLASGAARELGQETGGGLEAGIVARMRKVFGSDARSVGFT